VRSGEVRDCFFSVCASRGQQDCPRNPCQRNQSCNVVRHLVSVFSSQRCGMRVCMGCASGADDGSNGDKAGNPGLRVLCCAPLH